MYNAGVVPVNSKVVGLAPGLKFMAGNAAATKRRLSGA
jgi:hypothetical protein